MLTKNFYNIMVQMMRVRKASTHAVTVTDCTGAAQTLTLYVPHGTTSSCAIPYSLLGGVCSLFATNHGAFFGSYLGTGTSPATVDDYVMESPIADGTSLTIDTPLDSGLVVAVNPTYASLSATHGVTNNTSSPIQVTEIGLYGKLQVSSDYPPFLLDHTVLETPIILPPGETVPVHYEIKFPYGT